MINFNACQTSEQLMTELERFVPYWVGQVLPRREHAFVPHPALPSSLNRVLSLREAYSRELFASQNTLLTADKIVRRDNRIYFLDVHQSGPIVFAVADGDADPRVFVEEAGQAVKCTESLRSGSVRRPIHGNLEKAD